MSKCLSNSINIFVRDMNDANQQTFLPAWHDCTPTALLNKWGQKKLSGKRNTNFPPKRKQQQHHAHTCNGEKNSERQVERDGLGSFGGGTQFISLMLITYPMQNYSVFWSKYCAALIRPHALDVSVCMVLIGSVYILKFNVQNADVHDVCTVFLKNFCVRKIHNVKKWK